MTSTAGPMPTSAKWPAASPPPAPETRIGLTLLPSFYAYGGFGGAPPAAGQRRFLNDPDRFLELVERTPRDRGRACPARSVGIAPHSLRAVTPGDAARVVCERSPDGPIHIHAAEQTREVEDCVAALGRRPVEWLLEHAGVDSRWCVIHATHTTADGDRGAWRHRVPWPAFAR